MEDPNVTTPIDAPAPEIPPVSQPQADPVPPVEASVNQETPNTPSGPTPPTAAEIEQAAVPPVPTPDNPETLLQKFLNGEAIAPHPIIDIQIAPIVITKTENGGVIISPSGQILVKYK